MVHKILHTGSQKEPLLSLLRSERCLVDYIPLFHYQDLEPEDLSVVFDYCIVSSKRSVSFLKRNAHRLKSTNIYAVGEKTAAEIHKIGLAVCYVSSSGVQDIIAQINRDEKGCFIGSKVPSVAVRKYLQEHPICHHVAVYEQKENANTDTLRGYDAVLCTSANGASLLRRRGLGTDTLLVAIGATTARRAVEEGFSRVVCSERPTYEALAAKVVAELQGTGN